MPEFDLMMVVHVACTVLIIFNMGWYTVVVANNISKRIDEYPDESVITFDVVGLVCVYLLLMILSAVALAYVFSINGWVLSS